LKIRMIRNILTIRMSLDCKFGPFLDVHCSNRAPEELGDPANLLVSGASRPALRFRHRRARLQAEGEGGAELSGQVGGDKEFLATGQVVP
jgi:hypothetical protein